MGICAWAGPPRICSKTKQRASVAGTGDALRGSTRLLRSGVSGLGGERCGRCARAGNGADPCNLIAANADTSDAGSRVVFVRPVSHFQPVVRVSVGVGELLVPVEAVSYVIGGIVAQGVGRAVCLDSVRRLVMPNVESLFQQAMALPEPERAELAQRLSDTVCEKAPGYDEAWREEIEYRMAEHDSGQSPAIPWDDAIDRIFTPLPPAGSPATGGVAVRAC